MQQITEQKPATFVDRRNAIATTAPASRERRQFSDAGSDRPEIRELSEAIDEYKVSHHRRFITYEELYDVLIGLGYHK